MSSCESPYTFLQQDFDTWRSFLIGAGFHRLRDAFEGLGRLGRRTGQGLEAFLDRLGVVVERLGALAAALPGVGGSGVGGDPVHPRRELRFATEAPDAAPGPEIGVLGHVPCVLLVTGEPIGQGERVDVGLAHQLVECFPIALLGGPNQFTVVHGGSRSTAVRTRDETERLRTGHKTSGARADAARG